MSSIECNNDVGCEAFVMMDRREDGSDQYFIRKICRGLDGERTSYDLALDGQTIYSPLGTVLPPEASGDCSATVVVEKLFDLAPQGGIILDESDIRQFCATSFLRHFVYDCDGKIKSQYDTDLDGTPYSPVSVTDVLGDAIPSVQNVIWPSIRHELHPDDGGQHKKFYLPVRHPRTGEIGYVAFETATASPPTPGNGCNHVGDYVNVNTPGSSGTWRNKPNEKSRFTFKPDNVVRQMSMLRLEFHDIDTFEGVWGLSPWPSKIVDKNGETNTFEVDESLGAIHSLENDNVIYAYYYDIPEEITHLYRNTGGGTACHSPRFTGYTIEPGPCCSGCEKDEVVNCPEIQITGLRTLRETDEELILPLDGFDLVSVNVQSLRGETTVTTAEGSSILPEGVAASWVANGSDAVLTPLKVSASGSGISQANVTWVSRARKGDTNIQQMCDSAGVLTSLVNPFGPKIQILQNGVTFDASAVTDSGAGWYGMEVQSRNASSTITFSSAVDVQLGVHFLPVWGRIHAVKIPAEIELTWINENFVAWEPSTRILKTRYNTMSIEDFHPGSIKKAIAPSLAKFAGTNITQLVFEAAGTEAYESRGLELDYLAVTKKGNVKFIRRSTVDGAGNVVCISDETLDGKPYLVRGVAAACQH